MTDTLEGPEEEATKCQVDHFTILNLEICDINPFSLSLVLIIVNQSFILF